MKRKVNFYPDDFKLKVVQEYLTTDISRDAIMAKHGIGGHNCINNWMRKFGMRAPSQKQLKLQRYMSNESAKTAREKASKYYSPAGWYLALAYLANDQADEARKMFELIRDEGGFYGGNAERILNKLK